MVRVVREELVDDLNQQMADETVKFSLDGSQHEIDLTKENAAKLREILGPYCKAGRKVGRGTAVMSSRAATRSSSPAGSSRDLNQAIRAWVAGSPYCKLHEISVSDRGRIKETIVNDYANRVERDKNAQAVLDARAKTLKDKAELESRLAAGGLKTASDNGKPAVPEQKKTTRSRAAKASAST